MQRGFNSDTWLSASDFTEDGTTLVISNVEEVEIEPNKTKTVVFFENHSKGLVLNEVNTKIIEQNTGQLEKSEWKGYVITPYSTTILWRGEDTPCIRIKQLVDAVAFKK